MALLLWNEGQWTDTKVYKRVAVTVEDTTPGFEYNKQYLNSRFLRKEIFYCRLNFAINEEPKFNILKIL